MSGARPPICARVYDRLRVPCGRRLLLAALGALVAVTALLGAGPAAATTANGSNVWAGVIDTGLRMTGVGGTFAVPSVNAACSTASNVAIWVGNGGYGSFPFAQNGVSVTPSGASAWYALFDKSGSGPTVSVSLAMRAGDQISLSTQFSADHNTLTFTWADATTRVTVTRAVTGASIYYNGSSSEWVAERAALNIKADIPQLAHFTPITFTNMWWTAGAVRVPPLPASVLMTLTGKDGYSPLATVASPKGALDSFTTTWQACR